MTSNSCPVREYILVPGWDFTWGFVGFNEVILGLFCLHGFFSALLFLERLKFKFMHCCCLLCCFGQKSCTEFAGFWGSFSREISSKGFFFRLGFENLVRSGWTNHVLEKIVGERKRLKWVGFCSSASASKSQVIEC